MSTTTFKHSGDQGDIIYSLPTVRALGGGILYLRLPNRRHNQSSATSSSFENMLPLLKSQPYLMDVVAYQGEPVTHDLDRFRNSHNLGRTNLALAHARAFELSASILEERWIEVEPVHSDFVLVNRTLRYPSPGDWGNELASVGDLRFVGTEREHEAFQRDVFSIEYLPTANLLELARWIAGCRFFCGNQSCPLAIAEGCKIDIWQFVCPACPNCIFEREGVRFFGIGN